MAELVLHSADFGEGYRITSTGDGLLIETTDHHPFPLKLSREALAQFKLHFEQDHYIAMNAEEAPTGILNGILASLNHAIGLMEEERDRKWDVLNPRRAMVLLGGLDEEVVEKILREEGM